MNHSPRKHVHVLFDEYHSESWTVSLARAKEINPHEPAISSYQTAANMLADRDFFIARNLDKPLIASTLKGHEIVVLLHPCDPKWERTTSTNSPRLSPEEMEALSKFVEDGGGLVVITEYEHDKYGDNLNELISRFGVQVQNTTVMDKGKSVANNPGWFLSQPASSHPEISHLVKEACFYLSSSCTLSGSAKVARKASENADPSNACLVATAVHGHGRVVVVTDSNLFGDKYIQEFDHQQFWLNLVYWCSVPGFAKTCESKLDSPTANSVEWRQLKTSIEALRLLQNPDGSVPQEHHAKVSALMDMVLKQLDLLKSYFPHNQAYMDQLPLDFQAWKQSGFNKPDFGKSLAAFNPETCRKDNIEHLVVFPMYTPNASRDWRFETILFRSPWPAWLAGMESELYQNDKFVPGHLIDFSEGYRSECAVFFPETIAVAQRPTNNFATIFCDREARRLQLCALRAASIVKMELHPQLEAFLSSEPMVNDALALWDLIHDKSHSMGELPFDPFMIRQRAPYWMYSLEELRVDLRTFCEASRLAQKDLPFAHYVTYTILLDRIFRFPITGNRIRNYDGLGGSLLFSFLHQKDVLIWSENKLTIRWEKLLDGVTQLKDELQQLYKLGSDCSKMSFWISAHDLISKYVKPNIASKWKADSRVSMDESDIKKWIDLVHDDEFPLGTFHSNLQNKMRSLGFMPPSTSPKLAAAA